MKLRSTAAMLFATTLFAGVLAACGSSDDDTEVTDATLVIAQGTEMTALDPTTSPGGQNSNFHYNVFDGLYNLTAEGNIEPALSTAIESTDDGLQHTLTLRDDVVFHDGEPFTSADVKYTIERNQDPEAGATYAADLQLIESVETPDDHTVVLNMSAPDPILLQHLASQAAMIVPEHVVEDVGADEFNAHPIGTGPFMLDSITKGDRLVLARNDDYWGEAPALEQVTFRVVPEQATSLAALQAGEVDMILSVDPLSMENLKSQGYTVTSAGAGELFWIQLRKDNPKLANLEVRQAMAHAINREAIVDNLYKGTISIVNAWVPHGVPGFSDDIPAYEYDPDKARQLLADSGVDMSEPIKFSAPRGRWPLGVEAVQTIVGDLNEAGFNIELSLEEYGKWLDDLVNGVSSPIQVMNASNRLYDGLSAYTTVIACDATYSFWCDEDIDAAIEKAFPLSEGEREAAIEDLSMLAHERLPGIPLWELSENIAMDSNVQWQPTPASRTIFLNGITIEGEGVNP